MSRRPLLAAALAALATLAAAPALAQDWPQPGKTIQLVVPAPGGSGTGDTIARVLAEELQSRLKTTFVVDNKAGANGNIGASAAAATPGDGYHFLFSWAGTLAVNKALYKNLPFDAQKDFVPILLVADVPNILVVNNDIPARDLAEFERYAKANPGKLNFGSQGVGTTPHLTGELFARVTGAKLTHVPYRGTAQAVNDLVAGNVDMLFFQLDSVREQYRANKVKMLAVTTAVRIASVPEVPTMEEAGVKDFRSDSWNALAAPPKTPAAIIAKLNDAINAVLKEPEAAEHLRSMNMTPVGGAPDAAKIFIRQETERWGDVIRAAKISLD